MKCIQRRWNRPAAEIVWADDRRRQQHVEQAGAGVALAELGHVGAHGGAVLVHFQREHRAAGDVKREVLHGGEQVDWSGLGGQVLDRAVGAGNDMAGQHRHDAGGQRGGDGAALQFPGLAFREQQSLAGDRPQDAHRGGGTAEIAGIADQHMVDGVGGVDGDVAATEQGA